MEKNQCPICYYRKINAVENNNENIIIKCPRCGNFQGTKNAIEKAAKHNGDKKITAWLKGKSSKTTGSIYTLTEQGIGFALSAATPSPSEKQRLLLARLANNTTYPGEVIQIRPSRDYPLAYSKNPHEFFFYLDALKARRLITKENTANDWRKGDYDLEGETDSPIKITITSHGWDELDKYNNPSQNQTNTQVFVAMSFDKEMDTAWEDGIKQGIIKAGYKPYRTDTEPHIDRIDIKIISEIRKSRMLVADVTHQRPGVYFEAGLAIGLGMPVFWCVRDDDKDNIHFDTRQYNHITWSKPEDLREKLAQFIIAIAGIGTEQQIS